jgi:hypothetical protein
MSDEIFRQRAAEENGDSVSVNNLPESEPIRREGYSRLIVQNGKIVTECRWCIEGGLPEWSDAAKVWIHRRPGLDKKCTNPPASKP